MKSLTTKNIITISIISALYAAITIAAAPTSYGIIQCRVSEALTILPVFSFFAILGLTFGCTISNIYGVLTQPNIIPVVDIFIGSFATLIAAIITYFIGKKVKGNLKYILAPLPAVIVNALIIGTELTLTVHGNIFYNMLSVGLGEFVSCYVFGGPLMMLLNKNSIYKEIF